jgi:hypothetical protein
LKRNTGLEIERRREGFAPGEAAGVVVEGRIGILAGDELEGVDVLMGATVEGGDDFVEADVEVGGIDALRGVGVEGAGIEMGAAVG